MVRVVLVCAFHLIAVLDPLILMRRCAKLTDDGIEHVFGACKNLRALNLNG